MKTQKIRFKQFGINLKVYYLDKWEHGENVTACCITTKSCNWIEFNLNKLLSIETIIHEMTHAIRYELKNLRGFINLDDGDDEVLPYCLSYAVCEVLRYCFKHGIEIAYGSV